MLKLDENLQREWETLLTQAWLWSIDEKFSFTTNVKDDVQLFSEMSVEKMISKIEKKFNLEVKIDFDEGIIILFDWTNPVASIYKTSFEVDWHEINDHLYLKISKNLRWKWLWKHLLWLYKILSESDSRFEMFLEEFTNLPSQINLYQKFWYYPSHKIVNWDYVELSNDDLSLIQENMELLKNSEDKWLPFTVVLSSKN